MWRKLFVAVWLLIFLLSGARGDSGGIDDLLKNMTVADLCRICNETGNGFDECQKREF